MSFLKKIIEQQKTKDHKDAKPINLEALVNSGRVRQTKNDLVEMKKKSKLTRDKND